MITDLDILKQIMVKDFDNFSDHTVSTFKWETDTLSNIAIYIAISGGFLTYQSSLNLPWNGRVSSIGGKLPPPPQKRRRKRGEREREGRGMYCLGLLMHVKLPHTLPPQTKLLDETLNGYLYNR